MVIITGIEALVASAEVNMKIIFQVDDSDIHKVKSFYESLKDNAFVRNRIKRNLMGEIEPYTKELFWQAMICCLITTQQRSGPNSAATKFICTDPFPLPYIQDIAAGYLQKLVTSEISKYGLRRGNTIGEEVRENHQWLEEGGWQVIDKMIDKLQKNRNKVTERESATIVIDNLKGFGPKQSRNLLQSLGLTKYEIPVDSRIIKWLNEFGFPLKLTSAALADKEYFNLVLDGFQQICESCDIYPCVLDAAIFASFDEEWPEDKLIW